MPRHSKPASLVFALFALFLLPGLAEAANRTVCFHLKVKDDRNNCATAGTTGARRACNPGGNVDAVGHQIEVWDKDTSSADEKIGTWYIGGGGRQCVTFNWEGESYHKGESNPDLYIRYINIVNRTGYSNYVRIRAVQTNGSAHPATTWRNGNATDPDRYVARNCTTGTTCQILPGGAMIPTNDPASLRALRIMALDTAQHALQVFGEAMDTHADMHYPGKSDCPTSCAVNRDEFHITQSRGNHGFNVAHEVGHLIQMQEFNQDWLRNDCSRNGDGHSLTSVEWESCATTEGFADYVAVTSWWNPNNAGSVPMGWGRNFETATPVNSSCSTSAHIELQVAKAFWDFDDWNNEAGAGAASGLDDRIAYGTLDIIRGWRQFPNGNGNREDGEDDRDGVNMRDYWANNDHRFVAAGAFETLIQHNCLSAQTNG